MSQRPINSVLEEAHVWRATLDDNPTAAEKAAFERWLLADSTHRAAYERARGVWSLLGDVPPEPRTAAPAMRTPLGTRHPPVARPFWLIAVAAGLLLTVVLLLTQIDSRSLPGQTVLSVATLPGELRTSTLSDGSTVTLGGDSELRFVTTAGGRHARLLRGDAFFDINHDADRPFIVVAGPAEVRVTGTRFAIEQRGLETEVLVASGRVRVAERSSGRSDGAVELGAGQAVKVSRRSGVEAPQTVSTDDVGAWRSGRLIFIGVPLGQVVAALDRYHERPITLDYSLDHDEPLTATLLLRDLDGSLELLAETFQLTVRAVPENNALTLTDAR